MKHTLLASLATLALVASPASGEERHLESLHVDAGQELELSGAEPGEPLVLHVAGSLQVEGTLRSSSPLRIYAAGSLLVGEGARIEAPGEVWLEAGPETTSWIHGAIVVIPRDDVGGVLTLLGDRLGLGGTSELSAEGERVGGQIRVGGGPLGVSLGGPCARRVYVGEGASLRAAASRQGDGGRIVIWGDEIARCYGRLDAGDAGGQGGEVEVSGAEVDYSGEVWVGRGGVFRIDPATITITDGGPSAAPQADVAFADATPTTIAEQTLEGTAPGQNATIVLQAQNQITINDLADNSLTLSSGVGFTLQTRNDVGLGDTASGGITFLSQDGIRANSASILLEAGQGGMTGSADLVLRGSSSSFLGDSIARASGSVSLDNLGRLFGTEASLTCQGTLTLTAGLTDRLVGTTSATVSAGSGIGTAGVPFGVQLQSGGALSTNSAAANGDQFLNLTGTFTSLDLNAGTGNVTLTQSQTSARSVSDSDGAVDVVGGTFSYTATGADHDLGTAANPIQTQVNVLTLDTSAVNSDLHVHEQDTLTSYSLQAGTGAVTLRVGAGNLIDTGNTLATTGALTLGADAGSIGTAGDVFSLPATTNLTTNTAIGNSPQFLSTATALTALNIDAGTGAVNLTGGAALSDSDGARDLRGGVVNLNYTIGGNIGTAGNPLQTEVTSLTLLSSGNLFLSEQDGISGLNVSATAITLTAGGALADTDGATDFNASSQTITVNNGAFGASANPINIVSNGSFTLTTTTGNGDQFVANSAAPPTSCNLNAGTGNITFSAPQLTDSDGAVDFACSALTLTATTGGFGTAGQPLGTNATSLTGTSSAGNGSQFFSETNTLTGLNLNAGTGNVTLTTGGAISDADGAADVTCNVATITATTGGIGSAGNPIGTAVTDLSVTTTNGDQFFSEADALTAVNMSAGTGGITFTGGGALSDGDAAVDFACGDLSITLNAGDLGTSGNPIGTNVTTLATATAVSNTNQFISETDGLTNLGLTAGTGNVTLTAGGTLTDVASPAVLAATATFTVTSGTIGTAANRIGAQISTNLVGTTTNADQFWDGLAGGLPALTLNAGTGDIDLTSTGAISDTDGAVDLTCGDLTIAGSALGAGANPLGLSVTTLTSNTAGSNGAQFFGEANGLTALNANAGTGGFTLTSTTGNVSDADGANDVTAGAVAITVTAGSLGLMGVPVAIEASTSLAVDTSGTNANQFLTSTGTLPVTAANGLNAGTGTINLGSGTLLINGSSTAGLVQANGGTLGGTGTLGAVQVNTGATLAPGASPGVTNTGDLNLAAGSTTTMEIGGTSPGTGAGFHDQLNVTGTVTINATATLSMISFGGFAPSTGDSFTLVNNDGADAITGTFQGLAEGALVTGYLGSALVGQVSYVGGDGNDFVVTVIQTADLAVTKTVDVSAPKEGDRITYTVTVTNNGPASATAVQLTDALPAGLTLVTPSPSQGTYDSTSGLWTIGALNNGAAVTLSLEVIVATGTAGTTITNTTSGLSGTVLGGSTADDVGSVAITVATLATGGSGGGVPLPGAGVRVTKLPDKGCAISPSEPAGGWAALLGLLVALGAWRLEGARAELGPRAD